MKKLLTSSKLMFDNVVEKILETSTMFSQVKNDIFNVAKHVNVLAKAIVNIAHTVSIHDQAIAELCAVQTQILGSIQKNSVNTNLPKEKKEKATNKPN